MNGPHWNESTRRGGRRAAACAGLLFATIAAAAAGCGGPDKVAEPLHPPAPPPLRFVPRETPFVVDWDPQQIAVLDAVIRKPNIGAVVVAYELNRIRVLPHCWVSGVYVPFAVDKLYTGTLQIRGTDTASVAGGLRPEALQQVSTSLGARQTMLLDYRFVVLGRYDLSASRRSAGLQELAERSKDGCRGATHYVRAASTGAFERLIDARTALAMGAGQKGQAPAAQGGNVGRCVVEGSAADPGCSALVQIELVELLPAVATLRLTAFTVTSQPAPDLWFRFRGKNGYVFETAPFGVASGFADVQLPPAEVSEGAPLVVDVLQRTGQEIKVIGAGEVTPADLRRGVFNVELRAPGGAGALGTLQLTSVSAR